VDTLIITEPDFLKKMNASDLAELVRELLSETGRKVDVIVEPDWRKALALLHKETGPDELGVVSGTLYLISDVRTWMLYQTDSEKGW
jgi:dihydrofolate synthase/folylpolyglutamate synthase